MSNVRPVELEICAAVKAILRANSRNYIRKYSNQIRRGGQPTGHRSHKFYHVYRQDPKPTDLSFDKMMSQISLAVKEIDSTYGVEGVYGPFSGTSIRIYPII